MDWGFDRGLPIDRRYIQGFLQQHAGDIHGDVLELQEPVYTTQFGRHVQSSHVLDVVPNPLATVIADLRAASIFPTEATTALITHALQLIDDMPAALRECARILKFGGVLLATFPTASRVCLEYGPDGDFWRVTEAAVRWTAIQAFDAERVEVAFVRQCPHHRGVLVRDGVRRLVAG